MEKCQNVFNYYECSFDMVRDYTNHHEDTIMILRVWPMLFWWLLTDYRIFCSLIAFDLSRYIVQELTAVNIFVVFQNSWKRHRKEVMLDMQDFREAILGAKGAFTQVYVVCVTFWKINIFAIDGGNLRVQWIGFELNIGCYFTQWESISK